jgi:uncharacterized protein YhaN
MPNPNQLETSADWVHRPNLSPSPATTGGESAESFAEHLWDRGCESRGTDSEIVAEMAKSVRARDLVRDATLSAAHAEKVRELEGCVNRRFAANMELTATIAALTKERDELSLQLKQYTEAAPNKSDWCPVCSQGWDCAKEDAKHRKLLAAAQAECEAAGVLIDTISPAGLADRGYKTLKDWRDAENVAWEKYNAARRKAQG